MKKSIGTSSTSFVLLSSNTADWASDSSTSSIFSVDAESEVAIGSVSLMEWSSAGPFSTVRRSAAFSVDIFVSCNPARDV